MLQSRYTVTAPYERAGGSASAETLLLYFTSKLLDQSTTLKRLNIFFCTKVYINTTVMKNFYSTPISFSYRIVEVMSYPNDSEHVPNSERISAGILHSYSNS